MSPTLTDESPPGRRTRTNVLAGVKAVSEPRSVEGDARVHWFAPGVPRPRELTACNGHGNRSFHDRVAAELAVESKSKLGW